MCCSACAEPDPPFYKFAPVSLPTHVHTINRSSLMWPSFVAVVAVVVVVSWEISNLTEAYSSMQLTAEDGDEFVWSGRRLSTLQVPHSVSADVSEGDGAP